MSLADVYTRMGVSCELVLIDSSNDLANEFVLSVPYAKAQYLFNRPFLPTESLESGVDFELSQIDAYSSKLTLARPIGQYKLPKRKTSETSTQFAVWICNAEVDDQLMQRTFGGLVGIQPGEQISTDLLSNFIYGLHFLYLSGPTFQRIEQGLNLILGVPIARDTEEVLEVRQDVVDGSFVVITANHQYLLPKGSPPLVYPGDTVSTGTPLSTRVEVKDYYSAGRWWVDAYIPKSVIPTLPRGQLSRFASNGSVFDSLMSSHLYRNTFLVRVALDSTLFEQQKALTAIPDLVSKAKPSYTMPVYTWEIVTPDNSESMSVSETDMIVTSAAGIMTHINSFTINDRAI